MNLFEGVIPALITTFDRSGEVDYAALRRLVSFHLRAGVGGFYVTGSTGEWYMLGMDERKSIAETVIEEVNGRVPVAVHVGHFTTAWAVELARHAAASGADMVSSLPPGQGPAPRISLCHVARYYQELAEVGLPVLVYYLEGHGSRLDVRRFVDEIGSIDGVVGLKYTSTDLFPMQNISNISDGRLRLWSGHDQMALAGLMMNARGIIGSNYNYLPEIYVELYRACCAGNLPRARALQEECNRILWAVKQFGNLPAYKTVLEFRGLGEAGARLPCLPLSADQKCALRAAVAPFSKWLGPIG